MRPPVVARRPMALALLAILVAGAAYLAATAAGTGGSREGDQDRTDMATPTAAALEHELRVRETREGFAGTTGTQWVIEPSGEWRVERFINEDVQPPEKQGRLDTGQLEALAESLEEHGFAELAARGGGDARAGGAARAVTVTYGEGSVTVPLNPTGERLSSLAAQAQPGEGPASDVLEIVQMAIGMTGDKP